MEPVVRDIHLNGENDFYILYDQFFQKLTDYQIKTLDVENMGDTVSAYYLYSILKDFYKDIASVMNNSTFEKFIGEINEFITYGCIELLKKGKSPSLIEAINNVVKRVKEQNDLNLNQKKYLGVNFYVDEDTTYAVFKIVVDGKYEKMIVCRDLNKNDIYYGKNSLEDDKVVDFIKDKLIEAFDFIDSYRLVLPKESKMDFDIESSSCRPHDYAEYVIPFKNELLDGEISIKSNGYVDFKVEIMSEEDPYAFYSRFSNSSKALRDVFDDRDPEVLKKIPIDINELTEPVKEIVNYYMSKNPEVKKVAI